MINYNASFPESFYPPCKNFTAIYNRITKNGQQRARDCSVIICGTGRDVANILPKTKQRIESLGSLFKDYRVILYENDSVDNTKDILFNWHNPKVTVRAKNLGRQKVAQDESFERTKIMAECRNEYMKLVKPCLKEFDYVIVVDLDLLGGWSYEGICNSFGYNNWDVMTSNGLIYETHKDKVRRLFYDVWAFRHIGHPHPHKHEDINVVRYDRGEPPIKVLSGFGGLAIYRSECLDNDAYYQAGDCDHVTLHKQLIEHGYDKIFVNPSQITLYSETYYCA